MTTAMEGHIPTISFSARVQHLLNEHMRFAVVVKILGRFIRQETLHNKITTLWNPRGGFKLTELEGGCFMVKLSNEADYANALLGGPWVIFGHYLTVQPWGPTLSPANLEINQVYGWVRLPGLPYHYYHKCVLRAIGEQIGQLLKIDYNTEGVSKARFARLAVRLDLTKPLISRIKLDGIIQYVEYEGLPTICYECGKYGHLENTCPCKFPPPSSSPETPQQPSASMPVVNAPSPVPDKEQQAYGSWMQVAARGGKGRIPKKPTVATLHQFGKGDNRFSLLAPAEGPPATQEKSNPHSAPQTPPLSLSQTLKDHTPPKRGSRKSTPPKRPKAPKSTPYQKTSPAKTAKESDATPALFIATPVPTSLDNSKHTALSLTTSSDPPRHPLALIQPTISPPTYPLAGPSPNTKPGKENPSPNTLDPNHTKGFHIPPKIKIKGLHHPPDPDPSPAAPSAALGLAISEALGAPPAPEDEPELPPGTLPSHS